MSTRSPSGEKSSGYQIGKSPVSPEGRSIDLGSRGDGGQRTRKAKSDDVETSWKGGVRTGTPSRRGGKVTVGEVVTKSQDGVVICFCFWLISKIIKI